MAMSFTLVASCREALSGVVATRLIREQEAEDAKAKAYEEVSDLIFERAERSEYMVVISNWDLGRRRMDESMAMYLVGRLPSVQRRLGRRGRGSPNRIQARVIGA